MGQIQSEQERCRDAGFQEGKRIRDFVKVAGCLWESFGYKGSPQTQSSHLGEGEFRAALCGFFS